MLSYGLWTPDYTNASKELCSWNDHPHGQICSEIETWLQHDRKHEGVFQSAFLRTVGLIQPRVTPRQGVSTMQRYRQNLSRREGPNDGCREARKRMQPKKRTVPKLHTNNSGRLICSWDLNGVQAADVRRIGVPFTRC